MTDTMVSLNSHMLLSLAEALCRKYGMKPPTAKEISKLYRGFAIPLPLIITTESYMVWIDRYYAAVADNGSFMQYIYLTRHHILEERMSFRELKKYRKNPPRLPADIQEQFRAAAGEMKSTGRNIWFTKAAEELGLPWIRSWRNNKNHSEGENAHV